MEWPVLCLMFQYLMIISWKEMRTSLFLLMKLHCPLVLLLVLLVGLQWTLRKPMVSSVTTSVHTSSMLTVVYFICFVCTTTFCYIEPEIIIHDCPNKLSDQMLKCLDALKYGQHYYNQEYIRAEGRGCVITVRE